jgi:hypothetical protein
MQTRVHNKTARYAFASLREMGTYIADTPRVWKQRAAEKDSASYSWDLNAGWTASVDMSRKGWIEGAQRTQKALKAFAPATSKPDTRIDFAGYRPHVPLYCAGAPAHMVRKASDAESGQGKVLTLAISVCANAFTSAAAMSNYGIAVAQYVNQMERAGTRVHVIGAFTVLGRGWRLTCSWTVKRADQPLDLAVLAFTIGHPAMLRRIGLAMMERQSDTPEMDAYGSAVDTLTTDLIDAPNGAIVLNGMAQANTYAATPQAALEYVAEQIEKARTR